MGVNVIRQKASKAPSTPKTLCSDFGRWEMALRREEAISACDSIWRTRLGRAHDIASIGLLGSNDAYYYCQPNVLVIIIGAPAPLASQWSLRPGHLITAWPTEICNAIDANNKNKAQTWNAWSTLDNSTSHCLIFVSRSLRRRNPLMPFLFEHFFSNCSILSSSLVLCQMVRSGSTIITEETNLWRESRIDRKLVGRSSSLRLYFSHKSTMIFAILASLCITISHSSLYCFTSWWHTCRNIVRGNVAITYISHGECLKQETRNWGDKWELRCQGTPHHENCKWCLNRIHRNIIMWVDGRSWVRNDGGITRPKNDQEMI
jgi:hypothetical protein